MENKDKEKEKEKEKDEDTKGSLKHIVDKKGKENDMLTERDEIDKEHSSMEENILSLSTTNKPRKIISLTSLFEEISPGKVTVKQNEINKYNYDFQLMKVHDSNNNNHNNNRDNNDNSNDDNEDNKDKNSNGNNNNNNNNNDDKIIDDNENDGYYRIESMYGTLEENQTISIISPLYDENNYNDNSNNINNKKEIDKNIDSENNYSSFYKENQIQNLSSRSKLIRKIHVGTITPDSKLKTTRFEEGAREEGRRDSGDNGVTKKLSIGTTVIFFYIVILIQFFSILVFNFFYFFIFYSFAFFIFHLFPLIFIILIIFIMLVIMHFHYLILST